MARPERVSGAGEEHCSVVKSNENGLVLVKHRVELDEMLDAMLDVFPPGLDGVLGSL